MSQSQSAETGESAANPTRRKFIKGVTIGTGAATIGGVSTQTRLSPVQNSEALVPALAAVGLVGIAAGGVAIYSYDRFVNDPTQDVDENDPLENQAYSQALSNEGAFAQRRDNIGKDNRTKRFEDSLWSEVRAAGVRAFENGENASTALNNAVQRMEEVLNNRLVNIIRAWNAEMGSAQSVLQLKFENNLSNVQASGSDSLVDLEFEDTDSISDSDPSTYSTKVKNGFGGWVAEMDTVLRGSETVELWFQTYDGGTDGTVGSVLESITLEDGTSGSQLCMGPTRVSVDDPASDSSALLIDPWPYGTALDDTFTTYDTVRTDAETYLNNLETEYEKGTVEPSSVLTGRELMEEQGYVDENGELTEEYEGATDEERLAAESIASGMGAPDDAGVRARVNHASLSSERTGNLFIDFTGDGGSLSVGEIPASDYNYAIMGVTYDDGSFGVETLESEADDGTAQPIEVLEVIGAQERDFSYTDEEITVGAGGDVVIYEGTDPPEELANPSEYAGYQVDIETADSTETVDLSEITESGSQYIASTSLSEGTTVESITFRAPVNYEDIGGYDEGDTTVDLERLKEQQEIIENQQEQLEKLQNQATGGGGGFLPDVSVDSNSTIIAVVAVILVAFGLLGNN